VKLSLVLREEHTLLVLQNGVLRRISGLEKVKMAGYWRKQHSEKLHNLFSSPNIRMIK
jgi:hypothetical protein